MLDTLTNINPGLNTFTEENGKYAFTRMDSEFLLLTTGQEETLFSSEKETAILLLTGNVSIQTDTDNYTASRSCLFSEKPYCLHIPRNTKAIIKSIKQDSEILIFKTTNKEVFTEKFYTPEMVTENYFGEGVWDETAKRLVRDIFNYENASYSNLVIGEIINNAGRWSSYTPHWHRQPEVYFYKFSKPQGFGVSIIGDNAYVIKDNSFASIPGGLCHPQVSAPGYTMYYTWVIRHLENDPWNERIPDPSHNWLNE